MNLLDTRVCILFINNLSVRNLRRIKLKMKVSGQFQNIERTIIMLI